MPEEPISTAEAPAAPPADPPTDAKAPRQRPRWRRYGLYFLALVVAVIAGLLVTGLTVDLGPKLRGQAEKRGSGYVHRPMHIGSLSARLLPGVFEINDIVIEGPTPQHRPFLTAKKVTVVLPWWSIFTRKLVIESIEMTDWQMVVESWPSSPDHPNGWTSFPKFGGDTAARKPARFTSTTRSVVASRGQFTYEDHGTPWSTVARNLRVVVYRGLTDYRGDASFSNGTIKIQGYEAFRADMRTRFNIDGGKIYAQRLDLDTDGAESIIDGEIDIGHWPEQIYRIHSNLDFATQKNIFFHNYTFGATGKGVFNGTFHLFKGGRELKGNFSTPVAGVRIGGNDWRFPNLRGSVLWLPDRMEVTNATSGLYGGTARFNYVLSPLNQKGVPTRATWDVTYKDVALAELTDFLQTQGLRLTGRASGQNRLEWDLGKWGDRRGHGEVFAAAPPDVAMMTRDFPPDRLAHENALAPEAGPFNSKHPLGYLPIAGHVVYTLDPQWITLGKSWTATEKTYVDFEGRTAYGDRSLIPFHVTSLDWLESDRVLAGIMTAFGAPTGAVEVGGYGQFDGVMLASFTKPRIEGSFSGERMRAWDVDWGQGHAKVVIENGYALVSESVLTKGGSEITADGTFSLGYPRKDNGEEINARVRLNRRPMAELRHAFLLDDYPVDGLVSGEYHLYGKYETPFGFGRLVIDDGVAYGETFETANASLRFEGAGVRLDALTIHKSTGLITGAAWVGWDGNYSFNADGARIPVESLKTAAVPVAPLSGLLQFTATGTGTFDAPRYDVKVRVDDLFAGEEGIGQITGQLALRGELLTVELNAASPRLIASGSGRIALTDEMDAELTLRFQETSLDPYLRFFSPGLSPFTTAVAGGTVRVAGELTDVDHLVVEGRIEDLDLKLFDYHLSNKDPRDGAARPIELRLDQHVATIVQFRLFGEDTELSLDGNVNLHDQTIAITAAGDANLGILQGFYRDIRSSGAATLKAEINGPLAKPVFSGSAAIANGRFRPMNAPHALEAINGRLSFDAAGIRIDDIKARLATGDVTIGGRIALNGFAPGGLDVRAVGQQMRIRYPEGFVSTIDADLSLRGEVTAMLLTGTVTVHDALYSKRFEPNADLFSLTGSGGAPLGGGPVAPSTIPVRFDVQIDAPSSLRVENNLARLVASADLKLQGTYDHPILLGAAEIERGDAIFEGNRYLVTHGTIEFRNPSRIEPYFDLEAETRVRVPGQTYRVTLGFTGTASRMAINLNSDPPLDRVGIVLLLFGQTSDVQNAELRSLNPGLASRSEEDLLKAAGARLLAGGLSAPVNRVVEQTLGVDLQIAPSIGSQTTGDPLTPSARIILGKRISNRAYLIYSRALGTATRDQVLVLEYDQNDRVGWVLTQNSIDRTFSIDFRVRRSF